MDLFLDPTLLYQPLKTGYEIHKIEVYRKYNKTDMSDCTEGNSEINPVDNIITISKN
jgi:hypothetical protein